MWHNVTQCSMETQLRLPSAAQTTQPPRAQRLLGDPLEAQEDFQDQGQGLPPCQDWAWGVSVWNLYPCQKTEHIIAKQVRRECLPH